MGDIQPHQPAGGDAVPAATTDDTAAADRLIDAIVTVYKVPDVTHPTWCHPPNCSVRPSRAGGVHQSERHVVTTLTEVVDAYLEAGKRGAPVLILERRSRAYAEREPYMIVTLTVAEAGDLLAALTTLAEDLGPVTP